MTVNTKIGIALFILATIMLLTSQYLQDQAEAGKALERPEFLFEEKTSDTSRDPVTVAKMFGQYRVRSGDTIYGIAKSFGLTVEELMFANPQLDSHKIVTSQVLYLPAID